jgi:hypothetical protein
MTIHTPFESPSRVDKKNVVLIIICSDSKPHFNIYIKRTIKNENKIPSVIFIIEYYFATLYLSNALYNIHFG